MPIRYLSIHSSTYQYMPMQTNTNTCQFLPIPAIRNLYIPIDTNTPIHANTCQRMSIHTNACPCILLQAHVYQYIQYKNILANTFQPWQQITSKSKAKTTKNLSSKLMKNPLFSSIFLLNFRVPGDKFSRDSQTISFQILPKSHFSLENVSRHL